MVLIGSSFEDSNDLIHLSIFLLMEEVVGILVCLLGL